MVSVCLPSDALLQHLPSYLGFSYLGRGVSLHACSSKAQPLLLTLDEGYLLNAASPDLERGVAPLGPPVPMQPPLLGCGLAPPSCQPWLQAVGISSWLPPLTSDVGVAPLGLCPRPQTCSVAAWHSRLPPQAWGRSSRPPPLGHGVLLASAPVLRCWVAPLGCSVCRHSCPHL